jgi:signal transduction histidine kinase
MSIDDGAAFALDRRGDEHRPEAYITNQVRRQAERAQWVDAFERKVREPLGVISATFAALHHEAAEVNLDSIDALTQASTRAENMIRDLLCFVRWTVQGVPLKRRRVDMKVLCERVVDSIREAHSDRAMILEADESIEGVCDPDAVAAMLSNLILNALHHGAPRPAIRITLEAQPESIFLKVWNGGPAIDRRLRDDLFEPFVCSGSTPGSGLGLGLYFSREIVCAHGGSIDVQSLDRGGTTFRVRLPRI